MSKLIEGCPIEEKPMRDRAYTYRQLLELAAKASSLITIGERASTEHALWKYRNARRNELREWLKNYRNEAGDHFERDHCEPEDAASFDALRKLATAAQKALVTARSATRRAIVRTAAALYNITASKGDASNG